MVDGWVSYIVGGAQRSRVSLWVGLGSCWLGWSVLTWSGPSDLCLG